MMRETSLRSEDLITLILIIGVVVLAVIGLILHTRHEWRALRHRLFRSEDSTSKALRPGRVVERLDSDPWRTAIRQSLEQTQLDLAGEPAAAEAVAAARDQLQNVVTSIAREAMTIGELRSTLIRLDDVLVYILAFPGHAEDRRKFKSYQAFAEGWPEHASAVRRSCGDQAPPLVGLLYFLGLEARDITLLVAYEGETGRRYPTDLGGPSVAAGAVSGPTYQFATT